MTVLGVDFGQRHIGIAIGYTDSGLANPLTVINNSPQVLTELAHFIDKYQPQQLVVGLSEKESATAAVDFAAKLSGQFNLPVSTADETLSSQEANLKLRHISPKHRANIEHAAAAAIILERWLDDYRRHTL